ncbi:unnamed protein product, partial [Vitis vinifera]|uniref:Uncharacterized protein n=1 Tax=Vitis vinifera TaxID=29760 RepID=D7TWX2_VITVI
MSHIGMYIMGWARFFRWACSACWNGLFHTSMLSATMFLFFILKETINFLTCELFSYFIIAEEPRLILHFGMGLSYSFLRDSQLMNRVGIAYIAQSGMQSQSQLYRSHIISKDLIFE